MNIWMTFLDWLRRRKAETHKEWASVPAPNWACSRRRLGGYYW